MGRGRLCFLVIALCPLVACSRFDPALLPDEAGAADSDFGDSGLLAAESGMPTGGTTDAGDGKLPDATAGCAEPACAENCPDPCGVGTCENDAGDYLCSCPVGYIDDGTTCVDADECAATPCGPGTCIENSTPPGYSCNCDDGYRDNGTSCVPTECDLSGIWAVQTRMALAWPPGINGLQAGSGVLVNWEIRTHSYEADGTLKVSSRSCGGTTLDYCGNFIVAYALGQDTIWNTPLPPPDILTHTEVTFEAGDPGAGDSFEVPDTVVLLGVGGLADDALSDLSTGTPVDHDMDSVAGVTSTVKQGSSAQCGGAGYILIPGNVSDDNIAEVHLGSRFQAGFAGTVDSSGCDEITGILTGPETDAAACEQEYPSGSGQYSCPRSEGFIFDCRYETGSLCTENGADGQGDIDFFNAQPNRNVITQTEFIMRKTSPADCLAVYTVFD